LTSTAADPLARFAVHGSAVGITSRVPPLAGQIRHLLGEFEVDAWPDRTLPVTGTIWPYEQSHVLKHLSPTARRVAANSDLLELYEDEERFWLVDDRWGIAEVNLLKGQWRSWLLPQPAIDPIRCAHFAVLWPMAQILRSRGLSLVPAASVSFGDRSFLLISPFGIEPELSALIRGGYRIIGQSWTAIREEEGRFSMLTLPGHVERAILPGMRLSTTGETTPAWVDLMREHDAAQQYHGWCDAVLVVDPGRRPRAGVRPLDRSAAGHLLRQAWPIFELHPHRRHGQLPGRLSLKVPCYQLHLSRDPRDLLKILSTLRTPTAAAVARPIALRAAG
jgi:hypothetical protein